MNRSSPDSTSMDAAGAPGALSSLAEVVRERRRVLGLTLQDVADRVGCAKSYLSSIETGRRGAPTDEVLARLERALQMETGALVDVAQWSRTPAAVKRNVRGIVGRLSSEQHAARTFAERLAQILQRSGVDDGGKIRGELDEAYRSGELRRLVHRLGGPSADAAAEQNAEQSTGPSAGSSTDRNAARSSDAIATARDGIDASSRPVASGTSRVADVLGSGSGGVSAGADVALLRALPREVPLINCVAAGYPREFTDLGYPARVADEYVRCPDLDDADAFAARVVGDSMSPQYVEGDVVVFSPARQIKDGMDCFARLEPDHETTFKRVYFEKSESGEERIRLQPLNAAYPPRVVAREHVAGLYAAVTVMRKIG
ncbi:MAG: S24 family peptidase [Planctomycetota bacterium]|nr:S24 family peptidase [Planctomycetota bacterium]